MSARALLLLSAALLAFMGWLTLVLGPSRREYAAEARCEATGATEGILALWTRARVKGRVAVLLTRRLNGEAGAPTPADFKFLEEAERRGIVRTVYHVLPDGAWREVEEALLGFPGARRTPDGFLVMLGDARIGVLPLSRFAGVDERALVVVAPNDFAGGEFPGLVAARGRIDADLTSVLRGRAAQVTALCGAGAR
jgi:hypothetical protein